MVDLRSAAPNPIADETLPPGGTRLRVLLLAAIGPLVVGYAAVAAVFALVVAVASNAAFSTAGVLIGAAPGWLAACHVPLTITGHPLGALPLLPTLLVALLMARTARAAAERLDCVRPRDCVPIVVAMTVANALCGLALALVCRSGPVLAAPAVACVVCAALGGLSALAGVSARGRLFALVVDGLDEATARGVRAGLFGLVALLTAGSALLAVALCTSWHRVAHLFVLIAPGFGSGLGVLLLSVAYLPNAVVATASFAAGPGFSVGQVSTGLLGVHGGALPPLPLLGALPDAAASWWPSLLALPLAVGVLVGRRLRDASPRLSGQLRAAGVAALVVAIGCLVSAGLAGGSLGGGRFGPVVVPSGLLALCTFATTAVPAALAVYLRAPHHPVALDDTLFDDSEFEDTPLEDAELETADLGDAELGDAELGDAELGDAELGDAELDAAFEDAGLADEDTAFEADVTTADDADIADATDVAVTPGDDGIVAEEGVPADEDEPAAP